MPRRAADGHECAGIAAGGDGIGGCLLRCLGECAAAHSRGAGVGGWRATFAVNAVSLTGEVGGGLQPGANRHLVWNAGADGDGRFSSQVKFNIIVSDSNAPQGMAQIPAFPFALPAVNAVANGDAMAADAAGAFALPAVNAVANGRSAWAGLRWNGSGSSRCPRR